MITLDGRFLSEFGLIERQGHSNPMTPSTRDKTLVIPGRNGAYHFGTDWDVRPFNIPVAVKKERMEMQLDMRAFTAFLLDPYGQPREIKLIFDYEPDKFYMVKYSGQITPERLWNLGQFELPFIAYDPLAKFVSSTKDILMESDIPILSDITLDADYTYQVKGNTTLDIINDGTIVIRPTIFIEGTAQSLTLTLNGESFSFGEINGSVEINGEQYLVKVNGNDSLSATTGDLTKLLLLPGNNEVVISGSGININIIFDFHHPYM